MTQTATNPRKQQAPVTPQALDALMRLRTNLQDSASAALDARDQYMHAVYVELLSIVSKRVAKTQARMGRELVAAHRKQHKHLRLGYEPTDEGETA